MRNLSKTVYASRRRADKGPITFISPIEFFRGKSDSRTLQITFAKNEYDKRLFLRFQGANGISVPYIIYGRVAIRQFMADVVGYDLSNPNPDSFMRTENMFDKYVEIFSSSHRLIDGISPLFLSQEDSELFIGEGLEGFVGLKSVQDRYHPELVHDYFGDDLSDAIIDLYLEYIF